MIVSPPPTAPLTTTKPKSSSPPDVDAYFARAERWSEELLRLRTILLKCRLDESLKWRKPCYGFEDNNLAIIQPMKPFLAYAIEVERAGLAVKKAGGSKGRTARTANLHG